LGDVQLGTLEIKNGMVQLIQKGNVKNFAAFLKKDMWRINYQKRDYATFAYRIISKALNLIPTDMSVENRSSNWMIMVKATIDIKN
jgi:hypothetical protein